MKARVVWIVGAGCAVGRACARKLSEAGALIALSGRGISDPLNKSERHSVAPQKKRKAHTMWFSQPQETLGSAKCA
jgi:NADP-dependent 3-hydroxy acid dehydrogenase YdfG